MNIFAKGAASAALVMLAAAPAAAQDNRHVGITGAASEANTAGGLDRRAYSPYADRSFPTRPFFGDTHLHTSFSMDAGAFGARLGPREAYRFARGEQVTSSTGQPVKLSRPLDFLVVADHSDNMGFFPALMSGKPDLLADPTGRRWYDLIRSGQGNTAAMEVIVAFSHDKFPKALLFDPGSLGYKDAWQQTIDAAEEFNDPGTFTAFIGYEWTSNTDGNNLHRNIIYRDGAARAQLMQPFTVLKPQGSDDPVDLWKWMAAYEEKTSGSVLAIPHNGNLSNGIMFPTEQAFGKALDAEYVESRARWERLYEVSQTKGTGESHPILSPNDEFADFELWDKGNLDGSVAKTNDMLTREYAREALKTGLALEKQLGTNPYKFGMIASSDAHTGLAAMEEENFFGKTVPQEPKPERISATFVANLKTGVRIMDWEVGASGYAAVWATDNTREAIWDAMQRRETYATTGPRMIVRFFGGWEFTEADAEDRMPAFIGYAKGVPMGGDMAPPPEGAAAPTFLVAALRDPIGANLDRIQIVKGWMDAAGELHETIHDVAWSGDRAPDATTGKLPSVGDTVDVAAATYTNTIGAPELIATWSDPEFDASQSAFYYARVIEIPTPRWTAYDAARFGVTGPEGTRMKIVERAYTAPIWYTPAK
ncbi:DUF3604 domain-containing protein [Albimonas sp. CAU 1670]|uniref:DUF3604 domain-containing protein n=1 Tax=Albimonas sp. CAU 1670 TaxID=3032599 RepID=UPI0023DC71EB|nr:DUF3604 domain-containing protein [Albimonas sp. CAU 1670]MDF2233815.1 DUF3604 domain-containing protein [Albimonas sp. CAU 1670]